MHWQEAASKPLLPLQPLHAAGAISGMVGICAGQPLDTLRVRLQQRGCPQQTSTASILRASGAKAGMRDLFRGMSYPMYTIALQVWRWCWWRLVIIRQQPVGGGGDGLPHGRQCGLLTRAFAPTQTHTPPPPPHQHPSVTVQVSCKRPVLCVPQNAVTFQAQGAAARMLTGSDSRAVVSWQHTCISGMFAGEPSGHRRVTPMLQGSVPPGYTTAAGFRGFRAAGCSPTRSHQRCRVDEIAPPGHTHNL